MGDPADTLEIGPLLSLPVVVPGGKAKRMKKTSVFFRPGKMKTQGGQPNKETKANIRNLTTKS